MSQCESYICTNVIRVHGVAMVIRDVLIASVSMGTVQTSKAEDKAGLCY